MELRGAHVLLTGAGGGLGGYIARSLADEGADLALSDVSAEALEPISTQLGAAGRVAAIPADLSRTEGPQELVDEATEAIGPPDVLVNNAGVEFLGPLERHTAAELEAITRINLFAPMELTRIVLPGMTERGRGQIVNVASLAGRTAAPLFSSYCATKHGLVGFTHAMRSERPGGPVGFSVICPGFVERAGMYGRLEDEIPAPLTGTIAPELVGEAVVRAISRDIPEQIVNARPVKPLALLGTLSPGLAARLNNRAMGAFMASMARARGRL